MRRPALARYLDRNVPETTDNALADLLRRWAHDGATAPEIAAVLGAPLPTVRRFAQRHSIRLADGRRRRTWTHPTHIGRPPDRAVPLCGARTPSHSWIASPELAATCAECRRSWHSYRRWASEDHITVKPAAKREQWRYAALSGSEVVHLWIEGVTPAGGPVLCHGADLQRECQTWEVRPPSHRQCERCAMMVVTHRMVPPRDFDREVGTAGKLRQPFLPDRARPVRPHDDRC